MLKPVRKGQQNNIKMGYREKSKSQTPSTEHTQGSTNLLGCSSGTNENSRLVN
jgi:hypothetical protein